MSPIRQTQKHGERERETERERERVRDSSETAADSNQSHEATLQPTWLIHKKQEENPCH